MGPLFGIPLLSCGLPAGQLRKDPEETFFARGVDGPVDGRILVSVDVVSVSGRSSCSGPGVEKSPSGSLFEGSDKVV